MLELLFQFLIEFVGEWLLQQSFRGASRVARSRTGRLTVSALIGSAGGAAWGAHLRDGETWPRLLWVSLVLAAIALVLAVGRQGAESQPRGTGRGFRAVSREVVLPPWRWGAERLVGFALINLGISVGIFALQAPARLL